MRRELSPGQPVIQGCLGSVFTGSAIRHLEITKAMGSKRAQLKVRLTADPDITHTMLVLRACRLQGLQGHGGNQDNRMQTRPQIKGVRTKDTERYGVCTFSQIYVTRR